MTDRTRITVADMGIPARTKYVETEPFGYYTQVDCEVASGIAPLHIPPYVDGFSLTYIHASVETPGTTETMVIYLRNETDNVDLLSTPLSIDSGEDSSTTAATPYVIKSNGDEVVNEDDILILNFTAVHTTPAKGCIVTLGFA